MIITVAISYSCHRLCLNVKGKEKKTWPHSLTLSQPKSRRLDLIIPKLTQKMGLLVTISY